MNHKQGCETINDELLRKIDGKCIEMERMKTEREERGIQSCFFERLFAIVLQYNSCLMSEKISVVFLAVSLILLIEGKVNEIRQKFTQKKG